MRNNVDMKNSSITFADVIKRIEGEQREKYYKIIRNYEELVIAYLINLKRMLNSENNKAIIVYNLGLLIELFLKMIILKFNISNVEEIGNYNHQISNMFKSILDNANDGKIKATCQNIKERLSHIKQSNGNDINYNNYTDFRYNHKKGETCLIFIDDISRNDIKHIKEVLECIELVMK